MGISTTGHEDQNEQEAPRHESGKGFSADMRGNNSASERPVFASRYAGQPILSKGNASEGALRFVKMAKEIMEQKRSVISMDNKLTWDTLSVSSQETGYLLDGALVVARMGNDTAIMTLLFTGGQQMKRGSAEYDRQEFLFQTVASDQYSAEFKQNVDQIMESRMKSMIGGNVTHIGVLPIVESKLGDDFIYTMVETAISQTYSFMEGLTKQPELTIDALELGTHDLQANIGFHTTDRTNELFNIPERSDIAIGVELIESDRNRRNASRQRQNDLKVRRDLKVAGISAYVDLIHVGNKSERRSSRFSRREEDFDPRTYGLNLNIIEMNHPATVGHMVMALAQIPVMINASVMSNGLRPAGHNRSLRTYEALVYELPADCIETEIPENLTDKEWENLTDDLIYPEHQVVTLQIPRAGLNTSSHNILAEACDQQNKDYRAVVDIIIEAADNLTDGRFSESFGKGEDIYDIGQLTSRPVLLGYWTDANGQQRDLREIDYYAILTHFGKRNPEYVIDWDRCMYDYETPWEIRLNRMEEIIDEYTGGAYKILDRADNIELNTTGWLYKLTDACRQAGMVVGTDGITQDTSTYRRGYTGRYQSGDYEGSAFNIRRQGNNYGFRR